MSYRSCGQTVIKLFNNSCWQVDGEVMILQGASVVLGENALLTMGNKSSLGDRSEIICRKRIYIGTYSDITWDCQVSDFASHPIKDLKTEMYKTLFRPVYIGNYCWIGNRTTIQPGTILPDRIIVASNSLLNKDYVRAGINPYSIIGGIPARVLKTDAERNYDDDMKIQVYFQLNNVEEVRENDLV